MTQSKRDQAIDSLALGSHRQPTSHATNVGYTMGLTRTKAFVCIIDQEVLLYFANTRDEAIRRLITDSMIKGREQQITAEDVIESVRNGFMRIWEVNGTIFAEPWMGPLPEVL